VREGRWLGTTNVKPLEEIRAFVLGSIEKGNPVVYAMKDQDLVGWCDISRVSMGTAQHTGLLGMGVLSQYRGQGIGSRLLAAALAAASKANMPRVELTVYTNNTAAIALYRKHGFVTEGEMRSFAIIQGEYVNGLKMGRIDEEGLARFISG
jgi:ribosomal protein S18 acetylase RimI-like enzyme